MNIFVDKIVSGCTGMTVKIGTLGRWVCVWRSATKGFGNAVCVGEMTYGSQSAGKFHCKWQLEGWGGHQIITSRGNLKCTKTSVRTEIPSII